MHQLAPARAVQAMDLAILLHKATTMAKEHLLIRHRNQAVYLHNNRAPFQIRQAMDSQDMFQALLNQHIAE